MRETMSFKRGDIVKVMSKWAIFTPFDIWHYGVVVGENEIIHFNMAKPRLSIIIIKSNIRRFINGGTKLQVCSLSEVNKKFSAEEIATRAEESVGTNFGGFNFFKNNCEHFVNWCANGNLYSSQSIFLANKRNYMMKKTVLGKLLSILL